MSLDYSAPAHAPEWFVANLQRPGESRRAPYGDSYVHFLTWNWERTELPVLLLVHGFSGHARWWCFLAPFFSDRYRIASIDLPGMGDSGQQAEYRDDTYFRGLLAVIEGEGLGDVTIVGHSFGGIQTLHAMASQPRLFRQGIVVDSFICMPHSAPTPVLTPRGYHRMYASREECMGRFRLVPPQPVSDPVIEHYIAWHSCRQGEEGWHWKFDPRAGNAGELLDFDELARIGARVDFIYGGESIFCSDGRPDQLPDYFGNPGEAVIVPAAHHHLMIDHPLQLAAELQRLLGAS